jgi:hypothetical protein
MATLGFGVLFVAAVATAGDYIWYEMGVAHRMTSGVIHGAVLLTAVGLVLGAAAGRPLAGLPIGAIAGIGGALTYYALIATTGSATYGWAIPAAWVVMWFLVAALDGRVLRAPARRSWTAVMVRSVVAAVLSGLAFYLVLTTLWGRPPAGGRNYALQLAAWAFAWAPGILAVGGDATNRR